MRDSIDQTTADDKKATLLQNVYCEDPSIGGGLVGRPGFAVAGAQLASGSAVQGGYQFTKLDGTEYTVCVAGGKFYTYNHATATWTEAVNAATLSGASVTLDSSARVYFATIADTLVVSDGVNTPWTWDGTTNGGVTKLTNAPVLYGCPVVYFAKLTGIKNAERSTIVWSNENDPTTGYEAGGANNAWTLGQSDQEALHALAATNTALYYFRERSAGMIRGAIDTEFTAPGVHDDVDPAVGSKSPGAIVRRGSVVYFLDADGRPHVVSGGSSVAVWGDFRETLRRIPRDQLVNAIAIDWTPGNLVLFGIPEQGQSHPSHWLVYSPALSPPEATAIWRGFTCTAAWMAKDEQGVPHLMWGSDDGYVYELGNPEDDTWDDEFVSGAAAIEHIVHGSAMAADPDIQKRLDRLDVVLRAQNDVTLSLDVQTVSGFGAAQSVTVSGAGPLWDDADWDEVSWADEANEMKHTVGRNDFGRWFKPRATHETAGERFGFVGWRATAIEITDSPGIP